MTMQPTMTEMPGINDIIRNVKPMRVSTKAGIYSYCDFSENTLFKIIATHEGFYPDFDTVTVEFSGGAGIELFGIAPFDLNFFYELVEDKDTE